MTAEWRPVDYLRVWGKCRERANTRLRSEPIRFPIPTSLTMSVDTLSPHEIPNANNLLCRGMVFIMCAPCPPWRELNRRQCPVPLSYRPALLPTFLLKDPGCKRLILIPSSVCDTQSSSQYVEREEGRGHGSR
jgi:hypothetical protein